MKPPISSEEMGEPLYEAFYGLREQPFALSTDPRFIFWSAAHRRAFDDILVGLRRREGVLLLTGETGTGKTTLARAVIDSLGHRTFSALVLNPYMLGAEVLRVILRDFGLVSREEIRRGSLSRADVPHLLDTLETFLRSLLPLDARAVVIVDEAQSLSPEALDQIRLLGSYEEDGQRLLQIVLCGQPGLLNTLKTEPMRALNERITRRAGLLPLLAPEVEAYVRHRLAVAGGTDAVVFQPEAFALISEYSRGLPRRINVLCDRALEEGRVSGSPVITVELIRRTAKLLSTPTSATPPPPLAAPPAPMSVPAAAAAASAAIPTRPVIVPPVRGDEKTAPAPVDAGDATIPGGAETEMAAAREPRSRIGLILAVVLLIAAAAVAGYFAWTYVETSQNAPAPVAQPERHVGAPAAPLPVPADDELKDLMEGRWRPEIGGVTL